MERNRLIAIAIFGIMSLAIAHQYSRINALDERLDQMADRVNQRPAAVQARPRRELAEKRAEIKDTLERTNQRAKTERRVRWKELWRESLADEIDAFAQQNNIPPTVAEELTVIIEVHSEDGRLRWEQVHNGRLDVKDARQQTESARRALRDEVIDHIGPDKWAALDKYLELGHPSKR